MKLLVPIVRLSFKKVEFSHHSNKGLMTDVYEINRPKRSRKKLIPLIILVIAGLITWIVVRNLNAPAEGSISQQPPSKAEFLDPYTQPGTYNGKYVSFTYPAHYKKVPSNLSGSYLEVADFYSTDHTSKSIAVGITRENLDQDGSYLLRLKDTSTYHQQPQTRFGICFSSATGGSNYACFSQHNGLVISVTAAEPANDDLSSDAQSVLSSLHWKQ